LDWFSFYRSAGAAQCEEVLTLIKAPLQGSAMLFAKTVN